MQRLVRERQADTVYSMAIIKSAWTTDNDGFWLHYLAQSPSAATVPMPHASQGGAAAGHAARGGHVAAADERLPQDVVADLPHPLGVRGRIDRHESAA